MKTVKTIIVMLVMTTMFTCNSFAMDSVELAKYASDRVVQIRSDTASGTGCVISSDGLIITNYHVAGDKKGDLFVILYDGRVRKAKVIVKGDNNADVALIKIDATDLPYFSFGDSDDVVKGEEVMTVGFPFSLGNMTTFGHVTGVNITEGKSYSNIFYIMTDAAINPGNSGGGLVDYQGKLLGLNTAVQNGNNTGFVVPINDARNWISQLKKDHRITYVKLGLVIGRIGLEENEDVKVPDNMVGVVVEKVEKGSPSDVAGIKKGDIILDIGGTRATDPTAIKSYIYHKPAGYVVHMAIYRNGKYIIKDVKLVAQDRKDQPENSDEESPETPEAPTEGAH